MKTPTKINTLSWMGPLVVALSSIAIAGPNGPPGPPVPPDPNEPPPPGPKLNIDVVNDCRATTREDKPFLEITTEVTPSDSPPTDGGAEIQTPEADAAFQSEVCRHNPAGKNACRMEFLPAGDPKEMHLVEALTWALTGDNSIDLCALQPTLTAGDVVNAEVTVVVSYDGGTTTTWISQCDDDPDTNCGVDINGDPIVCEEFDESIVEVTASCPPLLPAAP